LNQIKILFQILKKAYVHSSSLPRPSSFDQSACASAFRLPATIFAFASLASGELRQNVGVLVSGL